MRSLPHPRAPSFDWLSIFAYAFAVFAVFLTFHRSLSLFLSRVLRDTTPRFVRRSVGWSHVTFFYDFYLWTSLLLPKWSSDLKYGPCSPARDFGSRVYGLVDINSHVHATLILAMANGPSILQSACSSYLALWPN